jgi:hypothetical protein
MTASILQSARRDVAGNQGSGQTSRATLLAFLVPAVAIFVLFTVYPVLRTIFNSTQTLGPLGQGSELGLTAFTNCGRGESMGASDSEPAPWTPCLMNPHDPPDCGFCWSIFPGSRTSEVLKAWRTS